MATDVEIDRVLAALKATLNDQQPDDWETSRAQGIVDGAVGGQGILTVDPGGGIHDHHGTRVAIVRRSPSGEWVTERQNPGADNSDAAVPASAPADSSGGE